MEASICIVSKNRREALRKTLLIIFDYINKEKHEVLVFLDGCTDGSKVLLNEFPDFKWYESSKSIGASPARRVLFAAAQGTFIIGFDDDAHPLQRDFIDRMKQLFAKNPKVGVLAFEEIKGIFPDDQTALAEHVLEPDFICNSFVGCGFSIRRNVYELTTGFPEWMDIYGEEGCVSIEVIDKGFDILFTSAIAVNHRVDRQKRKTSGSNVFRFQRQLCNMALYFFIFYPANLLPRKWGKLFSHNFIKYALKDRSYFIAYFKGLAQFVLKFPTVISYRKPVSKMTFKKMNSLPHPKYG